MLCPVKIKLIYYFHSASTESGIQIVLKIRAADRGGLKLVGNWR